MTRRLTGKTMRRLKNSASGVGWTVLAALMGWLAGAAGAFAAWPPAGKPMAVPVARDTFVSAADGEAFGSNGGAGRLKLKGHQEYILLDIDPAPLKGKRITGALLHLRSAAPRDAPLARVGVSTVASPWTEGGAGGYRREPGSACFRQAGCETRDWAYPGGSLMDVVFGHGHARWKFADATAPDGDGWQAVAVDPKVVAARAAGLSYGFCLCDEVGHIWSQENCRFEYTYFPNRYCHSRESRGNAPWLEVWTDGSDGIAPEAVRFVDVAAGDLAPGEAMVSWITPADGGGGETLGFGASVFAGGEASPVPRHLIPMAGAPGQAVRMHLQDLGLAPGSAVRLAVWPVDAAGNVGPPAEKTVCLAPEWPEIGLPDAPGPFAPETERAAVGGLKVAVVDLLDKREPVTGRMIPPQAPGYLAANAIYSAARQQVRLQAARNEFVCFQVNLEGRADDIEVACAFDDHPDIAARFYEFAYVRMPDGGAAFGDPLVPLQGPFSIPSSAGSVRLVEQGNHSLICELYVPHEEKAGRKKGRLTIREGRERLTLDVDLTVWNFTLPDRLSFVPEMNAYELPQGEAARAYYRLAHRHRACLNYLTYGWHGLPALAPRWSGTAFDWPEWDRQVGPLLDGTAFDDLPRRGEPVDVFYLPFSENWPVTLFDHFKPSYWADEAFSPVYQKELAAAFAAFARHADEKKWHDTQFQFYLNNKIYYRKRFFRSSAPWILDEPVNTQDFWALRWYGRLWQEAVQPVRGDARTAYRCDVSFTQYGRDTLWGVMDIEYRGGNSAQKNRMHRHRQARGYPSAFAEYGTANPIDASNVQPALWCVSAWAEGATGVLPWQTIGKKESWRAAEQTALFYPLPDGPVPSVRLMAFTRGQQDAEYLTHYCIAYGVPRRALARKLAERLPLDGRVNRRGATDAGTIDFGKVRPQDLRALRGALGKMISQKAPPYRRALVDRPTMVYDAQSLPDIGYVEASPAVDRYAPVCDSFRPCQP